MIVDIILMAIALALVVKAADWFLGSAETIGVKFGLPSFVLGVLVVGFGTSLPELTTSVAAVIDNTDTITIANIVGSNMANMLVIIGLSTFLLGTIAFDKDLIDLDLPLLFGVTVLFSILISDGQLSAVDGSLLIVGFLGYVMYTLFYKEDQAYHRGLIQLVRTLARDTDEKGKKKPEVSGSMKVTSAVLLGSVVLLALSSKVAVDSLLGIVDRLDVQVEVLTFFTIAIGTSLPELLVSYKSLRQGKGDIVLGNIIGSSIFNILLVGGVAAILKPQVLSTDLVLWSIVGLMAAVLMLVVSGITRRIHVWEGLIFILVYLAVATKLIG